MKIISWNLAAAHGPYVEWHERAWNWIAAVDPDIALLQECVPPNWARDHWSVLTLPYTHWASAIVVKRERHLRPIELAPDSLLGRLGSYLATAEIDVDGTPWLVGSVHTRAAEAPNWSTAGFDREAIARTSVGVPWSNDVAFAGYHDLVAGRRLLIGGDWNTARYVDQHGSPKPDGAEFFSRAADAGWFDLSLFDGQEGRTWYGVDNPRTYQPDHIFGDALTATVATPPTIDPYPVTTLGLSDHAPVILELAVERNIANEMVR